MPDLVVRGGLVIDGSGGEPSTSDVVVEAGRILSVGRSTGRARRIIDADGAAVAPGFIDLHTHCDFTIHQAPGAPSMVRQGVTTIVTGNCGFSAFPVPPERRERVAAWASFLSAREDLVFDDVTSSFRSLDRLTLAPNIVQLVGHGTLRMAVGLDDAVPASADDLDRMASLLDDALSAGAAGLSSGLIYEPGKAADAAELERLAAVAARHGTFYATHIRDEGAGLIEALDEAIDVAAHVRVGVHISHLKAVGRQGRGLAGEALTRIDRAVSRGLDVTADQYPYTASSTKLGALLGPGGLSHPTPDDAARVLIADEKGRAGTRRSLADVARELDVPVERALSALSVERGDEIQVVLLDRVAEEEVREVLGDERIAVASDGWTLSEEVGGNPHPRGSGTFVRVLGHYCRDERVLPLATAVRKMTAIPAARLGMPERGSIQRGNVADLVVFDPGVVSDPATFDDPYRYAEGVSHVIVGGHVAIDDGNPTGARTGRALRRTSRGWREW